MPTPYVSEGVRRIDTSHGNTRLFMSSGVMEARTISRDDGPDEFIPVSFADLEKTGLISFRSDRPLIQLQMTEGYVTLTSDGIGFGDPLFLHETPLRPWDAGQARRFARQLLGDQQLQTSLLSLHRNLFAATCEYTAVTGNLPVGSPRGASVGAALSSSAGVLSSTFGADPEFSCEVEDVVEEGTRLVEGWVDSVVTAAEQLAKCASDCLSRPVWEWVPCGAVCAAKAFADIVSKTWGLITELVKVVVGYIVTCELKASSDWIPTPAGKLDLGAIDTSDVPVHLGSGVYTSNVVPGGDKTVDVTFWVKWFDETAKGLRELFECLLHGEWDLDRLENLGLERIDYLREVPYGVHVCLDRACTDKLLDAIGVGLLKDLGSLITTLFTHGFSPKAVIEALAKFLGPKGLDFLAKALGIPATQLAGMLLAMFIIIDYQSLAIGGQILLGDKLGYNKNGVCLHYPVIAIGALAFWNPLTAAAIAANFPIIVQEK
jgi:hypothetical protein